MVFTIRLLFRTGIKAAIGFVLVLTCLQSSIAQIEEPPNIVVFMIEDMGKQLPVYGDYTVPAPNIDQLASQGTIFNHACAPQATCSPSRASFFTGLYPHQNGHVALAGKFGSSLHRNTPTLPYDPEICT